MTRTFEKTIAVIGGLGPFAGVKAIEGLFQLARDKYGAFQDNEYPEVILHSVPFNGSAETGIENAQAVKHQILSTLQRAEICGAELGVIACNSSHAFFDELQAQTNIELVSLVAEAAEEVARRGYKSVAVLSSQSASESGIYQREMAMRGVHCVELSAEQQQRVNELIVKGMRGDNSSLSEFRALARALVVDKADAVVLGCTELSPLQAYAYDIPVVDSLSAACRTVLQKASEKKELAYACV